MTTIQRLDHVNVLTANLAEMIEWYGDILDMHPGPRPPFSMGGAWLYANELPYVHLVETGAKRQSIEPKIEHFAFAATGLPEFLEKLDDRGITYSVDKVVEMPLLQVNIADVDGNHIHVDFAAEELPSKS